MTNNTPDYDNLYFPKPKEGENSFKATFDSHFSLKKAEGLKIKNNLTIDWENGKLPEGLYYVEYKVGGIYIDEIQQWYNEKGDYYFTDFDFSDCIERVLAPVPSYDEYIKLIEENKRIKHDVGNLGYKIKNQRKEIEKQIEQNAQLKELLKECKGLFNRATVDGAEPNNAELIEILTKIDEALK